MAYPSTSPIALTVECLPLREALKAALRAVEGRNTIPILGNVLLTGEGETLRVTGTNLDQEVSTTIPAEVSRAGAVTVPADPLNKIAARLPASAVVSFTTAEDGRVEVKAGRSRFMLPTLAAEDFPVFKAGAGEETFDFEVAGSIISDTFTRSKFAISSEETRYYLQGIYIHAVPNPKGEGLALRAVSTDGHRLARLDAQHVSGLSLEMPGVIVPRKTVEAVIEMGKDAGEKPLAFEVNARTIRVSAGRTSLVSKLIDGTFPDYVRVIPTDFPREAVAPTKALIETILRVGALAYDDKKTKGVKCAFGDASLTVTLRNPSDGGEAQDELDIEMTGASPFEIGFNSQYLAEILAHVGSDTVRVRLGEKNDQPLVVTNKLDDGLFVLMPLRIN